MMTSLFRSRRTVKFLTMKIHAKVNVKGNANNRVPHKSFESDAIRVCLSLAKKTGQSIQEALRSGSPFVDVTL